MGQDEGKITLLKRVIQLIEYKSCFLAPSELTKDEAQCIYSRFGNKVSIDWPTPKTGNRWQLTSQGWVGFIPVGENLGISLQPKVPIQNLFRMLEYAYDLQSFKLPEGLYDCESLRDFYDRLAIILAMLLLKRAREGLYKTYKDEYEELSLMRGCLDIPILSRTPVKTRLPCWFEDHTIDVEENQIIAWTLYTIVQSGICTERSIPILRKADRVMRNSVALKPFCYLDCLDRTYNRLNADYEIIHKLCRFFLENTGPTQNLGDRTMVPFLVEMAHLFELFVARWLKQNLDSRYLLRRQESLAIGEKRTLKMVMDLILYDRETQIPLCVLDTKYKADGAVSNDDYNQVVAYADAVGCETAVLIYPKELECPIDERPGRIHVKTVVFDIGARLDEAGKKLLEQLLKSIRE